LFENTFDQKRIYANPNLNPNSNLKVQCFRTDEMSFFEKVYRYQMEHRRNRLRGEHCNQRFYTNQRWNYKLPSESSDRIKWGNKKFEKRFSNNFL